MREAGALYDLIYGAKDYVDEVRTLHRHVRRLAPAASTWLDVACGTGKHLAELRRDFQVEGVDVSPRQLTVARERLPGVRLTRADMRELRLGRRFDVVSCLFSAIGLMRTLGDLRLATRRLAEHVGDGGVLVIEPWTFPENWRDGNVSLDSVSATGLALARACVSSRRNRLTRLDFTYVYATTTGTRTWRERLEVRLSTREELLDAVARAGLEPSFDEAGLTGRGLVFGCRA
ncbi:MAG: class I SAM-dependent methyltransferase [Gaiella sp.]